MPKQPTEEEKRHPAYMRYERKGTTMFLLQPVFIVIALGVSYLFTSQILAYWLEVYAALDVIMALTLGRSAERDRKEWQEWRKSRIQPANSETKSKSSG